MIQKQTHQIQDFPTIETVMLYIHYSQTINSSSMLPVNPVIMYRSIFLIKLINKLKREKKYLMYLQETCKHIQITYYSKKNM